VTKPIEIRGKMNALTGYHQYIKLARNNCY